MQAIRVERQIGGKTLPIETGTFAKLADVSGTVQYGESVVFAAVVRANPREGIDFFPLQVDYRERRAAAGKFPGGFMKREGRPTTKEVLTARLIDRPLRPLFPKGFMDEVQIQLNVLAFDGANDPDIFAGVAASSAIAIEFGHRAVVEIVGMIEELQSKGAREKVGDTKAHDAGLIDAVRARVEDK